MLRRLLAAVLALAIAAAGPAAAEEGQIFAKGARYDAQASHSGQMSLLFLLQDGQDPDAGRPWLAIDAAAMTVVSYSKRFLEPPAAGPVSAGSFQMEETARAEKSYSSVRARLVEAQPAFELHAFGPDAASTFAYQATIAGGALASGGPVRMAGGAFSAGDPGADDLPADPSVEEDGLDASTFAAVEQPGPLVLHEDVGALAGLAMEGDLVLELFGLTLEVASPEGATTFASGTWDRPLAGAPAPAGDHLQESHETFVRLFLDDATVRLAVDGPAPRVEWAALGDDVQADGAVTFTQSSGRVHLGDDEVAELHGDRYVLPAGSRLAIAPRPEDLAVDISEADVGPRGTIADVPAPASAVLVSIGAVLALAAALGVGVLRRVLRLPELAEVELAIEKGEYRRAARLAARILSRRPGDESALLARGIALTKAGRHAVAVRELSSHLADAGTGVGDGSLHYVLGLAQMDLGLREEGKASLREAVRRTPALQAEVGARLGKAFSTPTSTPRETSAYA